MSKTKLIKEKATILHDFSQCAFDILQIVKIVIKYPGEYKELNQKYCTLLNLLGELKAPAGNLNFKDSRYLLPLDIIYLPYREEKDKKVLYKAEENLRNLVFKAEQKRAELLGSEYKPDTGIRDIELKQMLEDITSSNTVQSPTTDIKQTKNSNTEKRMSVNNNNETLLQTANGGRLLNFGSKSVEIGSMDNVASKLYECLLPIEVPKRVEFVFDQTTPKTSKLKNDHDLTIPRKIEILKDRLKELQRKTSKKGLAISLEFINRNQNVYMKIREKSGS